MLLSRTQAAKLALEAVLIARGASYITSEGESVSIEDAVRKAQAATQFYAAEWCAPTLDPPRFATRFEVKNEPTLAAARRLFEANLNVAALNFASAKNPGGGFLSGARAQEEYLCRNSALYACLAGQPFYDEHRARGGNFYSAATLYSPAVPVFRAEDLSLCAPWPVAFLTVAAPNLNGEPIPTNVVRAAFRERIARVLHIALEHGHDGLILGAWGCGAFKNDPNLVARAFADAFQTEFRGQFRHVSFAVLDGGVTWPNFDAFAAAFPNLTDASA